VQDAVHSSDVTVHIDSLPFLGRLLVSGHVSAVKASVHGLTVQRLRFDTIRVDLRDVHIDRNRLVVHRQVDLKDIQRGTATAEITQADLRNALGGIPVVLDQGRIGVQVAGVRTTVTAAVRNNVLRLTAGPLTIPAITLPKLPFLPCVSTVAPQPGRLVLSCTVDQVPVELLRKVGRL
jgi:hypothetical protein